MKLSKNFQLSEFLVSKKYPEIAKKIVPTTAQILATQLVCVTILEKLRYLFGPCVIHSGIRNLNLNLKLGGVSDSDHLLGSAADVSFKFNKSREVFDFIFKNVHDYDFRQIIYYEKEGHLHIAINHPEKPFKKEMKIKTVDGKYINVTLPKKEGVKNV